MTIDPRTRCSYPRSSERGQGGQSRCATAIPVTRRSRLRSRSAPAGHTPRSRCTGPDPIWRDREWRTDTRPTAWFARRARNSRPPGRCRTSPTSCWSEIRDGRSRTLGRPADDAVGFQLIDFGIRQTQPGQQFPVVLTQERGMARVESLWAPGEPHRQGAVRSRGIHRVVDVLEESAEGQLRQLRLTMRLHHPAHGKTGSPEALDDIVAAARAAPRGQVLVDEVVTLTPSGSG